MFPTPRLAGVPPIQLQKNSRNPKHIFNSCKIRLLSTYSKPYTTAGTSPSLGFEEEICVYSMLRRSPTHNADNRSNETYFKCRLPDNQTDIPDKVIAIADGALWFMTDKELNPSSQCIWHKQSICLSFEVLVLIWFTAN
jgi:hypothetical protein